MNGPADTGHEVVNMTLVSLVIVGHFNPMILHAEWFRRFKVLPEEEIIASLSDRVVGKVSPDIELIQNPPTAVTPLRTQISFRSYRLLVTLDRFELNALKEEVFFELPSLAIRIFNILSHTPTRAVGFNYEAHWKLRNPWQTVLKQLFSADQNNLSSIFGENYEVGGKIVFDMNESKVTLILERSDQMQGGIRINFNFHREIQSQEAMELIDKIRSEFNNDLHQAQDILMRLLGEPTEVWRFP